VSFQAKLCACRRAGDEPLQDLHRDISCLVQLAYPSEGSRFLVHVGVDSFIAALNDKDLEFEILKLEPKTLEDVLSHAIRLEAIAQSVSARSHTSADRAGGRVQNRPRNIFAVTGDKKDKDENADLLQCIAQLEKQLKQATKGGNKNAQGSSKKSSSKRSSGRKSSGRGEAASATDDADCPNPQTHPCNYCNELGHWCKDCPKCKNRPRKEANVHPVLTISANMSPTKIYVTSEVNGEPVRCVLDSGCERSVIMADLAPKAKLTPSQYSLFAANKASLDVLSNTVIPFVIDGHAFEADVSVCNKVEDFFPGE